MTRRSRMNRLRRLVVVSLGASAAAAGASSPIVDIHWPAEGRFEHRAQVAPGKFVELCGKLAQGAAVRWRFDSSAPLDFNIHYHVGKDVVFPARQSQTAAGEDTLAVSVPQDYCWMWTNKGATPVTLTVELRR